MYKLSLSPSAKNIDILCLYEFKCYIIMISSQGCYTLDFSLQSQDNISDKLRYVTLHNISLKLVSPRGVVILRSALLRAELHIGKLAEVEGDDKHRPGSLVSSKDMSNWNWNEDNLGSNIKPGAVVAHPQFPSSKLLIGLIGPSRCSFS